MFIFLVVLDAIITKTLFICYISISHLSHNNAAAAAADDGADDNENDDENGEDGDAMDHDDDDVGLNVGAIWVRMKEFSFKRMQLKCRLKNIGHLD